MGSYMDSMIVQMGADLRDYQVKGQYLKEGVKADGARSGLIEEGNQTCLMREYCKHWLYDVIFTHCEIIPTMRNSTPTNSANCKQCH